MACSSKTAKAKLETRENGGSPIHEHDKPAYAVTYGEKEKVDQLIQQWLGRSVSDNEWIQIAGGLYDAQVSVSFERKPDFTAEDLVYYDIIKITSKHPVIVPEVNRGAGLEIYLYKSSETGEIVVRLENFCLLPTAPKGMGTEMFARMVAQLRKLPVKKIVTSAGRRTPDDERKYGRDLVGYYVWGVLGFDQTLEKIYADQQFDYWKSLPRPDERFKNCRTLLDLLHSEGGKEWWKENRRPCTLEFDLRENSRSVQILEQYLNRPQHYDLLSLGGGIFL